MSPKIVRVALIGVAVAGAAAIGVRQFSPKSKIDAPLGRTVTAKSGDVAVKVTETGTLEPVVKVDVKSRVAGRLIRIYVKPGQAVRTGDPIAIVDPTEVQREVAGVQAQLSASRAGLAQATENYGMARQTAALGIRRAQVNVENALVSLKDAAVSLRDAQVGLRNAQLGVVQAQKRLNQTSAPTRPQEVLQAEQSVRRLDAQIADLRRTYERRKNLVERGFLAQQDADAAQTQVALAETDLASAKERVALLKEGPRTEDIETIKVGVDAARLQVDQAQVRIEQTKVRYEQAQIAVKTARVQLETERANATLADLRRRDIERSRADVTQVENRLAQQSVQLTETRIVAPIAGEVTGKYQEEGELVASATAGFAQGAAIVTIADLSRMQVKVNVNEVDVSRLAVGQSVSIRIDGIPNQTFDGTVAAIAPASLASSPGNSASGQNAVVRFEVKVAVTSRDRRLRPGMSAGVDIQINRHANVVTLPAEALRGDGDSTSVMVVTGTGDKAVRTPRPVKIGLRSDATVEIVSGLKPGESVEVPKLDSKDRRKVEFNDGP